MSTKCKLHSTCVSSTHKWFVSSAAVCVSACVCVLMCVVGVEGGGAACFFSSPLSSSVLKARRQWVHSCFTRS